MNDQDTRTFIILISLQNQLCICQLSFHLTKKQSYKFLGKTLFIVPS